ncbi:MAG: 50S ribosomal protein L13 [Nitrospirae bacterium]|nr:MAG: 50S ribosomal protein L13 [Nitrospirota bacterium]
MPPTGASTSSTRWWCGARSTTSWPPRWGAWSRRWRRSSATWRPEPWRRPLPCPCGAPRGEKRLDRSAPGSLHSPPLRTGSTAVKTTIPRTDRVERRWYVVDAEGQTLGRLAARVASVLRGKHKPTFTPHLDLGDHVIVVNAHKVVVTGRKEEDKRYYRHTGWFGGLKEINVRRLRAEHPERLVEQAVRGMLPKNRLGRRMFRKLKVYAGPNHPHQAQKPEPLPLS